MTQQTAPEIDIRRRRDRGGVGVTDRRLRTLVRRGDVHRVVAGSFVPGGAWKKLTPLQRHLVTVAEVAEHARSPQVYMGSAAAAVWGIDRVEAWPRGVAVRVARATGGRSTGNVIRRALGFDGVELVEWRGHLVTSPAQTAIDLAADAGFMAGVVAMDQALWARRENGPLTTADEILTLVDQQTRRGLGRARAALEFSTPLADSVRESEARVLIDRLGFPAPVLQKEFRLDKGGRARSDFYWEDFDHVGEFDGTGKYFDPDLLQGRTPEQALLDEKDRGDQLRRRVKGMSRWRTDAHRDPQQLYDILTGDGLPSRLPRPLGRAAPQPRNSR